VPAYWYIAVVPLVLAVLFVWLFEFGWVGTERVWYLRVYGDKALQPLELWALTWAFVPRYFVLGLWLVLPVSLLSAVLLFGYFWGSPHLPPSLIWLAAVGYWVPGFVVMCLLDVLLTFVTPALAYTTSDVGVAWTIGWRMLRDNWPRSAGYTLVPSLALLVTFQTFPGPFLGTIDTLVANAVLILINLWAKGATTAFYLRRYHTGDTGAAFGGYVEASEMAPVSRCVASPWPRRRRSAVSCSRVARQLQRWGVVRFATLTFILVVLVPPFSLVPLDHFPLLWHTDIAEGVVRELAFSPISDMLATAHDPGGPGEVELWDTRTGHRLWMWHSPGYAGGVAFSSDGSLLDVTSSDQHGFEDQVLAVRTGRPIRMSTALSTVEFPPNGHLINYNDPTDGEGLERVSPDGQIIARPTSGNGWTIRLRDTRTGRLIREFPTGAQAAYFDFAPDTHHLIAAWEAPGSEMQLAQWDIPTGRMRRATVGYGGGMFALRPDRRLLATRIARVTVSNTARYSVDFFDTATLRIVASQQYNPWGGLLLTFSRDGRLLAMNAPGWVGVDVWDVSALVNR